MKQKILIVDDEKDLVSMIAMKLETEGYETQEAYDGKEALEKVAQAKPDLILLDIMMPGLNGYDVCQKLKADQETKNIPVIMLSARVQGLDQSKGKEAGADDYICKPFEFSELIDVVNTFLNPQQKKAV